MNVPPDTTGPETTGPDTAPEKTTRAGFAALIGAPNAGKSTLLNQLVGQKVAIVTHKAQTTRSQIRGIVMEGDSQIVLVDTPGIFPPRRRLDRAMVTAAWGGAADADVICVIVDAKRTRPDHPGFVEMLDRVAQAGVPALLVLNKVDEAPRENLLALAEAANKRVPFAETFMISALTGDGVADLRRKLAAMMPEGPWLYPPDQVADLSRQLLAAEITREKLYLRLHDELPYATTVETEAWTERDDGSIRIDQVIYVERDSQKAIVLGKGGRTIKEIGQAARTEMEDAFETKVHLFLFVKVREGWENDPERYRMMGLEFPAQAGGTGKGRRGG